jgi:uncharacterized membrane protein
MLKVLSYTFLFSILPFGEARLGIPYAVFNNVHILLAFAIGLVGNILVYPLLMWLIDRFNKKLWPFTFYKKGFIWFSRMAKKSMGDKIQKHGFWGLMIFRNDSAAGHRCLYGNHCCRFVQGRTKKAFLAISLGTVFPASL